VRSLAAAVGFLTRLPMPRAAPLGGSRFAGAALWFPAIGAAQGAAVGGIAAALALALPALLAATIAIAVELALTGALHVDGLADSADGLAGRDREHSLEIMRDHSLGAYGASALTLDLLAKSLALGALASGGAVLPVVAAFALSRGAPLPLAALLPYARRGPGAGRSLADHLGVGAALGGVAFAAVIAALAAGPRAAAMLAGAAVVAGSIGLVARRRLGGVTGDVMGAAVELTATLGLIVAAAS
jgi:adenosylcobinamide-GDP ribazoletransferase